MKDTLYILTGPCGVGKSTISYKLAQRFERSCHINADWLYAMVVGGYVEPWKDSVRNMNLLWQNIVSLVRNFTNDGHAVILDYIVFPDKVKYLTERLDMKIKYVVLMADEETIRQRDLMRPDDEIMGNRAIELLEEFKEKDIDSKYIINTSKMSIEEIIDIIINEDEFFVRGELND